MMKDQALFSSKDKSEKLECHLLQFLIGTLRVKYKFQLETLNMRIRQGPCQKRKSHMNKMSTRFINVLTHLCI